MPSGSDGPPRNLLQRDRRAPRCSAARSGHSSPQGSRIRDRQRVSALVSTPGRSSRLFPSYPGHGRAPLIHSCGRFLMKIWRAGRPRAPAPGPPRSPGNPGRSTASSVAATAGPSRRRCGSPVWARRFMMTSGDRATAWLQTDCGPTGMSFRFGRAQHDHTSGCNGCLCRPCRWNTWPGSLSDT